MPQGDKPDLDGHVELAWQDFLAEMERVYPQESWSREWLLGERDALLARAADATEGERYVEAGEYRAEARSIGALLASRGETSLEADLDGMRLDMARAIIGEAPEPRIVTGRHWETREKMDLVINDPDGNLTRLAQWTHAARHAMPYCLTAAQKQELGFDSLVVAGFGPDPDGVELVAADGWEAGARQAPAMTPCGADSPDLER